MVAESSARSCASARFDEEIDIEVRLDSLSTTSMTTVHTFRRGDTVLGGGPHPPRVREPESWTEDARGPTPYAPPSARASRDLDLTKKAGSPDQ